MKVYPQFIYLLFADGDGDHLLSVLVYLGLLILRCLLYLPDVLVDRADALIEGLQDIRDKRSQLVFDLKRRLVLHYRNTSICW